MYKATIRNSWGANVAPYGLGETIEMVEADDPIDAVAEVERTMVNLTCEGGNRPAIEWWHDHDRLPDDAIELQADPEQIYDALERRHGGAEARRVLERMGHEVA